MATVNYYLKDPRPGARTPTLIYLYFRFEGSLLKFSTGEKILPRNWNFSSQRAKKSATGATVVKEPSQNAILDRVVHNAHRVEMTGESLRRKKKPKNDDQIVLETIKS